MFSSNLFHNCSLIFDDGFGRGGGPVCDGLAVGGVDGRLVLACGAVVGPLCVVGVDWLVEEDAVVVGRARARALSPNILPMSSLTLSLPIR